MVMARTSVNLIAETIEQVVSKRLRWLRAMQEQVSSELAHELALRKYEHRDVLLNSLQLQSPSSWVRVKPQEVV